MAVIYKYTLEIKDKCIVDMHLGAIFLDLQMQNNVPVLWCIIPDLDTDIKPAEFNFIATGKEFDFHDYRHDESYYRGTIQQNGIVFHVFYKR